MLLNQEKLFTLPDSAFITVVSLLEHIPVFYDVNQEHRNAALNLAAQNLRNYAIELVDTYEGQPNHFQKLTVEGAHFLGPSFEERMELLKKCTFLSSDEETIISRESAIELASNHWAINKNFSPNFDRKVFLEGKKGLSFQWLQNEIEQQKNSVEGHKEPPKEIITAEDCEKLAHYLQKRFSISTLSFNSFETPQELFDKLTTLNYCFENITKTLDIPPSHIGFGKMDLSLGRLNDDCNGWVFENALALTQKADETILTHEWMHFFDLQLQENKDVALKWEKFPTKLLEDKFEKNDFDVSLFKNLDPAAFMNRFATNHVRVEKQQEFKDALSTLNNSLTNSIEQLNLEDKGSAKSSEIFNQIENNLSKFLQKFNSDNYFPDNDFLKRYMNFLNADFQLMSDIVKEKLDTNRSVFAEHAAKADENMGHHYSGNRMEMVARSFEAYLDDTIQSPHPLSTKSSLWYPVEKERLAINQLWAQHFDKIRPLIGSYEAPGKDFSELPAGVRQIIQQGFDILKNKANPHITKPVSKPARLSLSEKREKLQIIDKKSEKNYTSSVLSAKINKGRMEEATAVPKYNK